MGAYEALAASYDRLTNDVDYETTVAFYEKILAREGLSPRTAVDLACGTGSVTLLLAKKGLRVIGVDLSEEMLTVASLSRFSYFARYSLFTVYFCTVPTIYRLRKLLLLTKITQTLLNSICVIFN